MNRNVKKMNKYFKCTSIINAFCIIIYYYILFLNPQMGNAPIILVTTLFGNMFLFPRIYMPYQSHKLFVYLRYRFDVLKMQNMPFKAIGNKY